MSENGIAVKKKRSKAPLIITVIVVILAGLFVAFWFLLKPILFKDDTIVKKNLFNDGLLSAISEKGGQWGYINTKGEFVITPQFDAVTEFSDGYASVSVGGKWGIIDSSGSYVVSPQYGYISRFSKGVAVVVNFDVDDDGNDKYGLIDTKGKLLLPITYDEIGSSNFDELNSDGLNFDDDIDIFRIESNEKYGYANTKGEIIVNPTYDSAGSFSEGYADVCNNEKYGFIDQKGKLVIPCQYDKTLSFKENVCGVCVGEKWGVIDEVLELLMDLDASDEQLDCPFLYASAKMGHAVLDLNDTPKDMTPLFETILKYIPAPTGDPEAGTQLLISTIDYNEYVGRIGVGKVENGTIRVNQDVMLVNHHDLTKKKKVKVSKLYEFDGLKKVEVTEAGIGSIVAVSGIPDIHIGDTLCGDLDNPVSIPFQKISEPTISMNFIVNDSPLAGKEGKYVTSRHLRDRLMRELNTDVSLRVEETDSADCFKVSGRGELHLSVLIENMRREGYEFAVSKAEVIYKEDERGRKLEPMEIAYVDVPDEFSGTVIQLLSERKGELHGMSRASDGSTRLEFEIPARGLIGFRGIFMTSTKGTGILNTEFEDYAPYKGDIEYRKQGSLIAFEAGESVTYGLYSAQERGTLFIGPGEKVYAGMVIGQNGKAEDIELNVCKTKHLTNTRTSSSDEALRLTPPRILSLEQALDFIDKDELLEVTPVSLRIRKKELDSRLRKRAAMK